MGHAHSIRQGSAHAEREAKLAAHRSYLAEDLESVTHLRQLQTREPHERRPARGLQIGRVAGQLVGIVDWSCLDESGPPLFDLFHFIANERASRPGTNSKTVWHSLQDRAHLEAHELAAIEAYEAALALPRAWYAVIARAWPILFGAMAEEHWAFSRPQWLRRLFGLGTSNPQ